MVHILDLPKEIIDKIFTYYLATEKQKDFYLCIAKVCKQWKSICKDHIFWRKFDGSLPEDVMYTLCEKGYLSKTEELVYSLSKELKDSKEAESFFRCLPNLKSVDFSRVRHLHESTVTCLAKYCKELCKIKFSQEDYSSELKKLGYNEKKRRNMEFQTYKVSAKLLNSLLTIQGLNITVIDMSHSNIASFTKLLIFIADCCINLEKLFVENIKHAGKSAFPIDVLQKSCCKLKDLRLGYPVTFTQPQIKSLLGFPKLETFIHPNKEESTFTDKDLNNILFNSQNLETLDIKGCKSITVNGVLSLPATQLRDLYISGTQLHLTSRFREMLTPWVKSLRTLDVSRTSSDSINHVLSSLITEDGMVELEYLNVSNTRINEETVCIILENCDKLKSLNLTSCRSMGRGFNQEYVGSAQIKKLHRDILCQFGRRPKHTFSSNLL